MNTGRIFSPLLAGRGGAIFDLACLLAALAPATAWAVTAEPVGMARKT